MGLIGPEVWLPLGVHDHVTNDMLTNGQSGKLADPRTRALILAGRLAPGLTMASARPRLEALAAGLAGQDPASKGYHSDGGEAAAARRQPELADQRPLRRTSAPC